MMEWNKKEEEKYEKLLALFENSLKNSRDYRIGICRILDILL